MKKVLLIEPDYYTKYPPLGLLKLSTYYKSLGYEVKYVKGIPQASLYEKYSPDLICITSLFTYEWKAVHHVIDYCLKYYKNAEIKVGGIYASICYEHLKEKYGDKIHIHKGLINEVEDLMPDYSLVPDWKESIIFSSRGCIRKCSFCVVNKIERTFYKKSIKHLIYEKHNKIVIWDNNILASPYWREIFDELENTGKEIDFNQGLDARLVTEEVVERLKRLKIKLIRMSYDNIKYKKSVEKAVKLFLNAGFKSRYIILFCLYNEPNKYDTPETFLERIKDIVSWGVVAYPMRYEPLEPREKNTFVSPYWTPQQLELIRKAGRIIGKRGMIVSFDELKRKILKAKTFEEAFSLYKKVEEKQISLF